MSLVAQITRSLFPKEAPHPVRRPARGGSLLGRVVAIACALVPFAAVTQTFIATY